MAGAEHRRADIETEDLLGAAEVDGRAARGAAGLDHLRSGEDGGAAGKAVVELGAARELRTEIGAARAYGLRAAGIDDGRVGDAAREHDEGAAADRGVARRCRRTRPPASR